MNAVRRSAPTLMLLAAMAACAAPPEEPPAAARDAHKAAVSLVEVATSARQWTGLAVTPTGRIFVSFPRWSDDVPVSVAELIDGQPVPYPNAEMNGWTEGADPSKPFVCAQSVVADEEGSIWVLDPANPGFRGILETGPKLMRFNLTLNRQVGVYRFEFEGTDELLVKPESYLNDVRFDFEHDVAYITDSGDGAIIVTDLKNGMSRRLLDDHPSTQAEEITVSAGGAPWLRADGTAPRVHSDGIALSPDGRFLYYQALTGRTLYRVQTKALRDDSLDGAALAAKVEKVATTGPADGLAFGADGWLYISAIEEGAIKRLEPETGTVETVVQDGRIEWPDSLALDPEGRILFTTSRIHLGPDRPGPYRIFRLEEAPAGAE